jgi:hypothetical protein
METVGVKVVDVNFQNHFWGLDEPIELCGVASCAGHVNYSMILIHLIIHCNPMGCACHLNLKSAFLLPPCT